MDLKQRIVEAVDLNKKARKRCMRKDTQKKGITNYHRIVALQFTSMVDNEFKAVRNNLEKVAELQTQDESKNEGIEENSIIPTEQDTIANSISTFIERDEPVRFVEGMHPDSKKVVSKSNMKESLRSKISKVALSSVT